MKGNLSVFSQVRYLNHFVRVSVLLIRVRVCIRSLDV